MHEISLVRNFLNTLADEFTDKVEQIIKIDLQHPAMGSRYGCKTNLKKEFSQHHS